MIGLWAMALISISLASPARLTTLRCEYEVNPLGIDVAQPRLNWVIASPHRSERQTAYQVLVASSQAALNAHRGDLWDSGKVASNQSVHVVYAGKPLRSGQRAWWKVRIWDRAGQPTAWSRTAWWEMGLLTPTDWKGQWVGRPAAVNAPGLEGAQWLWHGETAPPSQTQAAARYFRFAFDVASGKRIRNASLLVTADNTFLAWLNSKRLGAGSDWRVAQNFDILGALRPGRNLLAISAVNTDGPAGLLAALTVTFDDGQTLRRLSGPGWKAAQERVEGWNAPEFNDTGWPEATVIARHGDAPWGQISATVATSPAIYLRKPFTIEKSVRRARLYATAKGLYRLRLNGQRVGADYLTPGWTDYRVRIPYQTYDVTRQLKRGANALGILLGEGWYCGYVGLAGRDNYGSTPRALAQLAIEYADGTTVTVPTDSSWKASEGPIRENDLLMGETYDARKELPGWDLSAYDDSRWEMVAVEPLDTPARGRLGPSPQTASSSPRSPLLVAQRGPTVRKFAELRPKSLTEKPAGSYVFDLGQNMVGWARLKVQGPAGTTVRLRFAEMLNPDGSIYTTNLRSAKCTDYYTLKGSGEEVYEPTFTFHGFRYVEVTGYPGKPTAEAITGIVVTSAHEVTGTFSTSDPMVNQLQSNIVWGQMGNYLEVPTDCPQRDERLGWMGDAQVFIRTACFNRNVAGFMTKWVQDVVDGQSPGGGFPDVAPRIGVLNDGSPAWGDAGVIVPWTLYLCYGDTRLLETHYEAMKKWVEYIHEGNPNLLWINRSGNNYGDWLNIGADMPRDIIGTSYFAYSTRLVSKIAKVLGKTEDAARYERLFQKIRDAYNAAYVRPDGRILSRDGKAGDTQSCYLLALRFDLLPEAMRPLAVRHLVNDIVEKRKGHLSTGFVGVSYLNPTLTQVGHTDLAYRLLLNKTFPSWGYSIQQGATTIWERWDGWTVEKGFQDPGMNSFNHYALGSVGEWLYATVAGIDLDPERPGYKHIVLRPRPGGGLTFAKAAYDSLYGKIVSEWKSAGGRWVWKVVVPPNTTATVFVPTTVAVQEGDGPAERAEGVRFLRREPNATVYEVGSGNYLFSFATN